MQTSKPACLIALLALALVASSSQTAFSQGGSGTGTIVGVVTMNDAGAPLPYTSIQLVVPGREQFSDAEGRFRLDTVPAGVVHVRVRHVGYTPIERTVTVVAGATDTLRVVMAHIVIQLAAVKVTADAYCGRTWSAARADTNVKKILDQLLENADRNRQIVRDNPYRFIMTREFAVVATGMGGDTAVTVVSRDTVHRQSAREWRYKPGTMIDTLPSTAGLTEVLNLLELSDIADDPFLDNHCWQYRGFETVGNERMLRLDFQPATSVKVPDVSGRFYLDTATYQLRQSSIQITRSDAPLRGVRSGGQTVIDQHIVVTTTFREQMPGVPVFDRVESTIERVETPPCRQVNGPPLSMYDPVTHKYVNTPTTTTNCPPSRRTVTRETQRFVSMAAANDST